MYSCIIIDDQQYAIDGLKKYIENMPELQLIKTFNDSLEALKEITIATPVDFIFMDIDMPKVNGIELAKAIRQKTDKLIFTTSHTKYGYEAFELDADGYLLKPYTFAKFAAVIAKALPNNSQPLLQSTSPEDFFFVKDKNNDLKIVKIRYQDVVAVESQKNYVLIHSIQKKVLTYMSLTEISKSFNNFPNFAQFQRSFILNKDHIESITGNMIKMANGTQITVGEHYRNDYNAFLERNLIKAKRRD